ncbi:MAG: hypothetical protein ABW155_13030 [Candidatus Thiodiazotropha sp.]
MSITLLLLGIYGKRILFPSNRKHGLAVYSHYSSGYFFLDLERLDLVFFATVFLPDETFAVTFFKPVFLGALFLATPLVLTVLFAFAFTFACFITALPRFLALTVVPFALFPGDRLVAAFFVATLLFAATSDFGVFFLLSFFLLGCFFNGFFRPVR